MTEHLRNKMVAGALAAVPIAVVVIAAIWIESHTRPLTIWAGVDVPGLGILVVLVGIYLLGVVVTSVLGQFFMRLLNTFLERVPGVNLLYKAWKDLLVVSPDKAGMYHQAVLVPVEGACSQLGFTNGQSLPDDPTRICVFLPNLPNPFTGRLVIMPRESCTRLPISSEEALKYQLSSGNYVPLGLTRSKD